MDVAAAQASTVTVHRFFVPPAELAVDRFPIPASIERQVRRVLRLGDGDRIVVMAGDGSEAACRIEGADLVVESRGPVRTEPVHRLTVVQALLKGDALESAIARATEVGVAAFRLVVTDRSVARAVSDRKLDRLRAIAREASEQSERGVVPEIHGPVPLATTYGPGSVVLTERHAGMRLRDVDAPGSVVIGPEGGFTPAELDSALGAGATLAGLGPRILRSETVAAVAAAVVLSRTGDFA